jgi:flagellar motor component MotA
MTTTEIKVEYFQSVTRSVDGLSSIKKTMEGELKEVHEHYEKQSKHLEKFQK